MIHKCPQCKRPNALEAARCIYCGAELPRETAPAGPEAKAEKAAAPKAAGKEPPQRLFLMLAPPASAPEASVIKGFSQLMAWDTYTAKLRLKSPSPAILRAFDRPEQAQRLGQALAELGLDSYLVKESGLNSLDEKQIALSAEIKEQSIIFSIEEGTQRALAFTELFLLVRGRARLEGEIGQKLGKLKVPELSAEREKLFDRLIERRLTRKSVNLEEGALVSGAATEFELFDLYARDDHRALRVIESRFDFSPLFGPEFHARLLGMAKFLELLKTQAPALILNENFNSIGYTYKQKPLQKKKLLLSARPARSRALEKLHNSEARFTEYSGLLYLYYLRSARKKAAPAAESQ